MSGRAKLTVFAALATLLTSWSLSPLVESQAWLLQAALLLTVQSAVGAGARRVPLARSLTVAAQLLVSLLLLALFFAGKVESTGSGPLAYFVTDFGSLFAQGVHDVGEFAIPAPLTDGIQLLLVSGVLVIGLLVDLLAVTARTAAAAGLPLLALYSVAAGLSGGGDASWFSFLLAGCGYLMLLLSEGRDRLAQWGRVFGAAPGGRAPADSGLSGNVRATAPVRFGRRIGALALGMALVVPAALPALDDGLLGGPKEGEGSGGSGGTISAVNPLVSLQSNLNAQDNRVVLRYRTDSPQQGDQYLRILALDDFNGSKWEASGRALTDVPQQMPVPPGLGEQVRLGATEVTTNITASDGYTQRYLPMPYPATSVDIPGKWRFEPVGRTLVGDQLARDRFQTVQGAEYKVRSLLLKPTAQQLQKAPAPDPAVREEYTRVPDNLPQVVGDTARQVTQGAKDDYSRAVKLQDFFAVSGGFRYDTQTTSGTGPQAVARFLADKEGFCIHFAFSMAAMSRTLGIPARVAVGFTPGEKQPDGIVNVSMRDAHAWPELYFQGVGWTRFEPTPRSGLNVPDYSRPPAPTAQPSAPAPLPSQGAVQPAPAPSASAECPPALKRLGECGPTAPQQNAAAGAGPSVTAVLGWAALVLAVVVLPLLPLLWRNRLRARRLASGEVLASWRELGDAAWDVGVAPDEALSPRRAASRVVELGRLEPDAAAAVHRVAGAVERALYAPPGAEVSYAGLADDVRQARAGLLASAGRLPRLRALLLPRSAARIAWAVSARRSALTSAVSARLTALRLRLPLRSRG
ncbi:transglutaminaseTgpA domain-containing protein [Streptomyces yangpuensis]|uniref:TransglutaminaseTgpA domain-containing protein n=1 Tax=Streptomyces yangpuensis TaxID=1648182 RepID=A0ABY5PTS6_9ACTN|nr:transglutaminaseTgpA domain-containing protein [Streptomyces yangpuensis]UUY47431.1 transglutaminaseTgpA domain-containing protein [Streptomyces yangpuensis]